MIGISIALHCCVYSKLITCTYMNLPPWYQLCTVSLAHINRTFLVILTWPFQSACAICFKLSTYGAKNNEVVVLVSSKSDRHALVDMPS